MYVKASPYMTTRLSDHYVHEGDSLDLHCAAMGNPRPQIRWYSNALQPSARYTLSHTTFTSANRSFYAESTVHIDSLEWEDAGAFQCAAYNELDTTYSTALVRILGSSSS